jgi:hypothetical protein
MPRNHTHASRTGASGHAYYRRICAGEGGNAFYKNTTTLTDGLTYENDISYTTAGRRLETFTLEKHSGQYGLPHRPRLRHHLRGMTMPQMIEYATYLATTWSARERGFRLLGHPHPLRNGR